MLCMCADCDSRKSLLLCEVLAACERYHGLLPYSVAPTASQVVMISDLLDAIAYELLPVSSNGGSEEDSTVPDMPYVDEMTSFVDDSQEEATATCQFCGTENFMTEHNQMCCRKQIHSSIFGDDSDVEDEVEDELPMSPRIARTKPKRHASMSTLIGIRKSLYAEKDLASITPAHEPKRRRVV